MDILARRHGLAFLSVTSTLLSCGSAFGQTGPDLLLGQFGEGQNAVVRGEGIFLNTGDTDNGDSRVQLSVYNASARFKLDLDNVIPGINRAQPRAGMQGTFLDFHTSDDPFLPEQFADLSFGVGLGIAKGEKWVAGLSVAVGHASADPFSDGNGWYGRADLAIGYTFSPRERLGIVIDYNGNRTFMPDIPLPGIQYTRVLSDQITIQVGFPFSDITYKPDEKWTLMFRYLFPDGGEANVDYAVTQSFHVYASLQQQNEAFAWDELEDTDDRVIFRQIRAELGLRGTYQDNLSYFIAGGYAFNTELEVGWDSRDTEDLTKLSDEPYVRVGFEVKF